MAKQVAAGAQKDPKAWARRIIERHEHRDGSVTPTALQMAREALGLRERVRVPGEDDE